MPDKQPSISLTQHEPANMPMKNMKVTHELVIALSDRIYDMLLRELKVERERQRFLNGSQRR